jgi:hypothetical protein
LSHLEGECEKPPVLQFCRQRIEHILPLPAQLAAQWLLHFASLKASAGLLINILEMIAAMIFDMRFSCV